MALNVVALTGRLVREPEVKKTQSGVSVCSFSIAVERPYKSGEDRQADFFDCVSWRHNADFIQKYFHKGDMIGVSGHLQTRSWEGDDGKKRKNVEVSADNISFVGGKKDANNASDNNDFTPLSGDLDGELPF